MSDAQSSGQSKSERFKNYLIGIGATTGLILGLLAQFKGEPIAEKTWETLREQVNKQTESINELYVRMEAFQAAQDARSAADLEHELEDLQKKYDALLEGREGSGEENKAATKKCSPGYVTGSDGVCRAVHASVANRVKKSEKRAASAIEELQKERTRRLAAEDGKNEMLRKLSEYGKEKQGQLETLPKNLDEASK